VGFSLFWQAQPKSKETRIYPPGKKDSRCISLVINNRGKFAVPNMLGSFAGEDPIVYTILTTLASA
jgi:hypothetical protein